MATFNAEESADPGRRTMTRRSALKYAGFLGLAAAGGGLLSSCSSSSKSGSSGSSSSGSSSSSGANCEC
jgi:hypothetical protein